MYNLNVRRNSDINSDWKQTVARILNSRHFYIYNVLCRYKITFLLNSFLLSSCYGVFNIACMCLICCSLSYYSSTDLWRHLLKIVAIYVTNAVTKETAWVYFFRASAVRQERYKSSSHFSRKKRICGCCVRVRAGVSARVRIRVRDRVTIRNRIGEA